MHRRVTPVSDGDPADDKLALVALLFIIGQTLRNDHAASLTSHGDKLSQLFLIMPVPVGAGAVTYAYRRSGR